MARRIRAFDWASTPLGPISAWPQSLRTAVDLILGSPFASAVLWGPELIYIHNEAAALQVLGTKASAALGRPAREVMDDSWPVTGSIITNVLATGETFSAPDVLVTLDRGGGPRQAYFTMAFSTLHDDAGSAAGVLATGIETTEKLHTEAALRESEARQAFLLQLSDALRPLADPVEIQDVAARLLGQYLRASRASYAEVEANDAHFSVHRDYVDGVPSFAGRYLLDSFGPGFVNDFRAGRTVTLADAERDVRVSEAERAVYAAGKIRAFVAVPLVKGGRLAAIFSLHRPMRHEWSGAEVALVEDVAERTWAAAERARAETALRQSEARHRFLLQFGDTLRSLTDEAEVLQTASRLLGEYLDADRAFFGELHEDEDLAIMHPDYARNGLPSLAGRFKLSDFQETVDALQSGHPFVIDDVATSGLLSEHTRSAYLALGYASYFSVPLYNSLGQTILNLSAVSGNQRSWSMDDVRLTRDVAARTWSLVERIRAENALRHSEAKYRTLFDSIDQGFCTIEVLFGAEGRPIDYRFLEVNPAFERNTGLAGAVGQRMRELAPAHEEHWFEIYGAVARTREARRFEAEAAALGRWYNVYAYPIGKPDQHRVAILFEDITDRKHAEGALRESEAELQKRVTAATAQVRELSRRLLLAQEEERRSLARELHDEIGQMLTGLQLQMGKGDSLGGERLAAARETVAALTEQVRQLSMELRPAILDQFGLLPALHWHIGRYQQRTGVAVDLRQQGLERRLLPQVEIASYRIVQEALTNVARHSGTSQAEVRLFADDGVLILLVRDGGFGFDPATTAESTGLGGMRERAELLGGIFTVDAAPGTGVAVTAELPLTESNNHPAEEADA
jgi:PAS domain S-box-containing protein